MTLPLHTKYRPPTLDKFLGHESLKASLSSMLKGDNTPHAYCFYGPPGCGKTTLGRIVANYFECDPLSLIEIDASADRGIENARGVIEEASYKPMHGGVKVYIFDEAHGLTPAAQDALLKTLEECPTYAYFVLCSTDPQKIKATIRSRCAEYFVSKVSSDHIKALLCDICDAEGMIDVPSDEVLRVVVEYADGVPRDALMYLGMVKHLTDAQVAEELLSKQFGDSSTEFLQLFEAVVKREPIRKILACYKNLPERDPIRTRISIANGLRTRMMNAKDGKRIADLANLLQYFARQYSYEMAEAELMLDFYIAVTRIGG